MLTASIALCLGTGVAASCGEPPIESLRQLYYAAVQDGAAIPQGMAEIERLRARGIAPAGTPTDGLLSAYGGALVTLRAKHGFWPHDRLRHLRAGLRIMDAAVAEHPEHPEIRYLRLMSCYYLPGILGRKRSVREDFAALARLLPAARGDYPPDLYRAIVGFVMENGEVDAAARRSLDQALAALPE